MNALPNQLLQDFVRRVSPDCFDQSKGQDLGKLNCGHLFFIFKKRVSQPFWIAPTLPQKNAQLDEESQLLLHDVTCLWHWLRPKMESAFPAPVIAKHDAMFQRGTLSMKFMVLGKPVTFYNQNPGLRGVTSGHQGFWGKRVTFPSPESGGPHS